jgi:hypothetical protein
MNHQFTNHTDDDDDEPVTPVVHIRSVSFGFCFYLFRIGFLFLENLIEIPVPRSWEPGNP